MHSDAPARLKTTKWMLLSRFYIDHTHPQVWTSQGHSNVKRPLPIN